MYDFELNDPAAIISRGNTLQFNFARALKLLAIATAPSPASRYQPGTNWSVIKYATAIEPRLNPTATQTAVVNTGIWDLDPHQKSVLADELGMALSLAAIDTKYGIDGIYDCYALAAEDQLFLNKTGRHRSMPDFLTLLRRPIAGSRLALLECKGSTQNGEPTTQLETACWQLDNVTGVLGLASDKRQLPRVATASTLYPGSPVIITVSDPPEEHHLPDNIETRLRANYVALELAGLGDIAAANAVRKRYDLPSWTDFGVALTRLPDRNTLITTQTLLAPLMPAAKWLSAKARKVTDADLIDQYCIARSELIFTPSLRAQELKQAPENQTALTTEAPDRRSPKKTDYENTANARRSREEDHAEDGSTASLTVEISRPF